MWFVFEFIVETNLSWIIIWLSLDCEFFLKRRWLHGLCAYNAHLALMSYNQLTYIWEIERAREGERAIKIWFVYSYYFSLWTMKFSTRGLYSEQNLSKLNHIASPLHKFFSNWDNWGFQNLKNLKGLLSVIWVVSLFQG